jgi:hypothetical protein
MIVRAIRLETGRFPLWIMEWGGGARGVVGASQAPLIDAALSTRSHDTRSYDRCLWITRRSDPRFARALESWRASRFRASISTNG